MDVERDAEKERKIKNHSQTDARTHTQNCTRLGDRA